MRPKQRFFVTVRLKGMECAPLMNRTMTDADTARAARGRCLEEGVAICRRERLVDRRLPDKMVRSLLLVSVETRDEHGIFTSHDFRWEDKA